MNHSANKPGRRLRVAVVGCGKMGINHIKAIRLQKNAELVALSDSMGASEGLAPLMTDGVQFFKDAEEMLSRIKPDVTHITTPPSSHAGMARLALGHGSHVYIEKPFTLRRADAEEVLAASEKANLRVCPGHQVLFTEAASTARSSLGEIGRIVHVESYFSFRMVRRNITPVDQLIDILPHPVYLLIEFISGVQSGISVTAVDVDPDGEVRALVKAGDVPGIIVVTLRGRPVESYLRIVGTNGSLHVDFVRGIVIKQAGPGASAPAVILAPYIRAKQEVVKSTMAFARLALKGQKNYPGLAELIEAFYSSIVSGLPSPVSPSSILDTVGICETAADLLNGAYKEKERAAERKLREIEAGLSPTLPGRGGVIITGGTGFLGRAVASRLRAGGLPAHVLSRHAPPFSARVPGVTYSAADLSVHVPSELIGNAEAVVHCAAETAGGREEHERNSISATRNIIEAAARAGIKKFIHVSSIAVLKPGNGRRIDESAALDSGNLSRGPYVWGKAESEKAATELCRKHGMELRTVRLGPLIDYGNFSAPGRLGREVGPMYIAVGSRKSRLPICEVQTAAEVILSYLEDFKSAPAVLNLIDPEAPTRAELLSRVLSARPDLKAYWLPFFVLSVISPVLKLVQRILLKSKNPIDIKAAFSAEEYETSLSSMVIKKARALSSAGRGLT